MKAKLTSFVSLSATLMASMMLVGCAANETILSIHYNSPESMTFYQRRPIAGLAGVVVTDTITLVGDTTLVQSLVYDDPTYYSIYDNDNKRASLLLPKGGGNLALKYDLVNGFVIEQSSTNAAGQHLYDSLDKARNMYGFHCDFSKAPLDTVASVMKSNFRTLADDEITQFEKLKIEGEITQQMFDQAVVDINYYYAYKMAEVIVANAMDVNGKRATKQHEGYADLWRKIYATYPIDRKAASASSGWHYMSKKAQFDPIVINPNMAEVEINTAAEYLQFKWDGFNRALAASEPIVQQIMLGQSLWHAGINNNSREMKLDTLIAEFNSKFKGSHYAPYLQRFVDENRVYHEALARPMSDKVIFIENPESVKSLSELFDRFKGQPIYVDFWFSSCGPCRDEFAHSAKVHEFLAANGIVSLFISIDQPRAEQDWHNTIKFFNLEGRHIRVANTELSKDIFEVHKIHTYPRYIIVNSKGNIVEANAKAPSEGAALFEQLKEKLKL